MSNTGFIVAYVKCVSSAGIYYKYLLFYYLQNCCSLFSRLLKRQLINQNCNTENSREQIKSTKLTIPQILTDHFTYIAFTGPKPPVHSLMIKC